MKKYTQAEFDAIPVDENGIRHCPTGDYTAINRFDEICSFGAGCSFSAVCSFGAGCSFGEICSFGAHCNFGAHCICEFGQFVSMLSAGGFGSQGRTTYFFLLLDGRICVRCGCFAGTLDEWAAKVKQTHGDSQIAKAYLLLIPAVKAQFERGGFCNG